ncbi:hypothetical protein VUN82_06645 [Micrococcaceae bacterium Sec5.1]
MVPVDQSHDGLLVAGFVRPLVIAVIQQSRWSPRRQSIVAFCFYVVVAAVTALLAGIFTTAGVIVAILVIFCHGRQQLQTVVETDRRRLCDSGSHPGW